MLNSKFFIIFFLFSRIYFNKITNYIILSFRNNKKHSMYLFKLFFCIFLLNSIALVIINDVISTIKNYAN